MPRASRLHFYQLLLLLLFFFSFFQVQQIVGKSLSMQSRGGNARNLSRVIFLRWISREVPRLDAWIMITRRGEQLFKQRARSCLARFVSRCRVLKSTGAIPFPTSSEPALSSHCENSDDYLPSRACRSRERRLHVSRIVHNLSIVAKLFRENNRLTLHLLVAVLACRVWLLGIQWCV